MLKRRFVNSPLANRWTVWALALSVGVALLFTFSAMVSAQRVPPHVFVGTAKIDGVSAPNGTTVTAWVDGKQVASTTVSGGSYTILLDQGDLSFAGKKVFFKVGGNDAAQSATWSFGGGDQLNLTATTPPKLTATLAPAAQPHDPRGLFGTVVSVAADLLVIETKNGTVNVPISEETRVRLPRKKDAEIIDLAAGDLVAVSLTEVDGQLVAEKVHLVPGKTQHRHLPGVVVSVSATEITIQPPGQAAEPVTFAITPGTVTRFHRNVTVLKVGAFVVVDTTRDALSGELLPKALAINVTAGKPGGQPEEGERDAGTKGAVSGADIRGVFEGVDLEGNWIVDGAKVAVDPDTEVASGVAAGAIVKIDAELSPDGTLLARRIERERRAANVSNSGRVEGPFEGVDSQGNWIIGGSRVAIGRSTDTDGMPFPGQRVKVKGHLRKDGSLLAREVENRGGARERGEETSQVKLEGIFQGTDDQGNWVVNGIRVAVDALTRLEGTPGVGRRVAVKAVLQPGGSLLAQKLEGEDGDEGDSQRSRGEAKLRGLVQKVLDDGTLVVNDVKVGIDVLTELEGRAAVGDFVEVEGLLREDGSILAKEVTSEGETETEDGPERSKVDIEGKIEKVNPDGSLVVNGIRTATSVLSEIKGELVEGSPVRIKGVLRQDGTLLASQLRGEGRRATASGTEAKIEGLVQRLNRDQAGNIVSFVLDGLTVATGALTRVEGQLEPGARVEVKAIISDGGFLASRVEASERATELETSEAKLEGIIEAIQLDAQGRVVGIKVNGLQVALAPLAKLEGPMAVGDSVEIKGRIQDGAFEASKVESERPSGKRPRSPELKLEGLVEVVERDAEGNVLTVVVNGQKIGVEALTRVKGSLDLGATVKIKAVAKNGGLIASEVKGTPEQRKGPRERSELEGDRGKGSSKAGENRGNGSSKAEEERKPGRNDSGGNRGKGSSRAEENRGNGSSKAEENRGNGSSKAERETRERAQKADKGARESAENAERETREAAEKADEEARESAEKAEKKTRKAAEKTE